MFLYRKNFTLLSFSAWTTIPFHKTKVCQRDPPVTIGVLEKIQLYIYGKRNTLPHRIYQIEMNYMQAQECNRDTSGGREHSPVRLSKHILPSASRVSRVNHEKYASNGGDQGA